MTTDPSLICEAVSSCISSAEYSEQSGWDLMAILAAVGFIGMFGLNCILARFVSLHRKKKNKNGKCSKKKSTPHFGVC